jgi:Ankyrin repeats (many copies)
MPQLHRLINQATNRGSLPLHYAADKCETRLLRSLLSHQGQDYTAVDVNNNHAINNVKGQTALMALMKTLIWASISIPLTHNT